MQPYQTNALHVYMYIQTHTYTIEKDISSYTFTQTHTHTHTHTAHASEIITFFNLRLLNISYTNTENATSSNYLGIYCMMMYK